MRKMGESIIEYDAAGNIISLEKTDEKAENIKSLKYSYNKLNQLTSCTEDGVKSDYIYNIYGNMVQKKVNGKEEARYEYNNFNQLIKKTSGGIVSLYSYDKRGNLTAESVGSRKTKEYIYDAADHMREGKNLETGEESRYTYNGLEARVGLKFQQL